MNQEAKIQAEIVRHYNNTYCLSTNTPRCLIFAVPNGGLRTQYDAITMKATGTMAGVADLIVIHKKSPDSPPIALFVEVKTAVGRIGSHQAAFGQRVADLGLIYTVVRSLDEFKELISKL